MKHIALVVIAKPQEHPIEDPKGFLNESADQSTLSDADYHVIWEPGHGFTVVQHPLDVKGSKTGFIDAPDVTRDNLDERLQFALNETDDLTIWLQHDTKGP